PRDNPRWLWLLWRPLPGHRDLDEVEQADSRATFRLILDRCDPNLRAPESGQTMLHEVIARDHGVGVSLATMLLDAGARTDIRDEFLKSTPLGWACRWGRVALVELLLARGADPSEAGAEPWAKQRAAGGNEWVSMNQCFFCGPTENKITEEHVWPLWVSELLRGKYGSDHFIHVRSTGSETTGLWKSPNLKVTTETVCDRCNNNWLSAFENDDVRPLATPLILGERVDIIKPDDQWKLAAWAYKMALLLEI